MTPEQITDLIRELAVVQYERDLCTDAIATKDTEIAESLQVQEVFRKEITSVRDRMRAKDARIAELERENAELNMAWRFEHGASEALIRKCDRLSAALKVAREAIKQAPHETRNLDARPVIDGCTLGIVCGPGLMPCNCWIREALAAIDAATTGLPLPLAAPPQPT